MTLTAKDVLLAVRHYKFPSAVIREVTVTDPLEQARRNLWNTRHPQYGDYYRKRHEENPGKWPLADELPAGWKPTLVKFERRIDALVLEEKRTAVEIKVTRSDFKADTPEKRAPWVHYTHKFVYAVPEGLVSPDEVPEGCGLWYISGSPGAIRMGRGRVRSIKRAKVNKNAADLPDALVKSLLGRLSRYELRGEKA